MKHNLKFLILNLLYKNGKLLDCISHFPSFERTKKKYQIFMKAWKWLAFFLNLFYFILGTDKWTIFMENEGKTARKTFSKTIV